MISFTTAELNALIAAFIYPLARILALLVSAPPFNNVALTTRLRLMIGISIVLAIAPGLPKIAPIEPASGMGLLILAQQMLIGFSMGFCLRFVFSAIDLAGNMISNQMGLGFATSYDPQNTSQTPVVSEFIGFLATLIFLSINGHLMVISTLVQSFTVIPIGAGFPDKASWLNVASAGSVIFSSGLFLALPIVVALMITNTALGILSRVSPQLNLMAIGFPITIVVGFICLMISLSYLGAPLLQLFELGLQSMLGFLVVTPKL